MKYGSLLLVLLTTRLGSAQLGVYAYLPAKNSFLHLKSAKVETTLLGTVVRTSTDLVYEPPPKASQVSFNFELPQTSTMGGFGYFEGNQFVRGRLQVKNSAYDVNMELGTGLRVSSVMGQSAPTVYRCEMAPAPSSEDLHVRLWTVGVAEPHGRQLVAPRPALDLPVKAGSPNWLVKNAEAAPFSRAGDYYTLGPLKPIAAVAQKFSDGRYYVAGYMHPRDPRASSIEVLHAYYEPVAGSAAPADVTGQVADLVRRGQRSIWASNATFGDPLTGVAKRLRLVAKVDGRPLSLIVSENETMNLFGVGQVGGAIRIPGLNDVKWVFLDSGTVAFFGWEVRPNVLSAKFEAHSVALRPTVIRRGSDVARLWAQQILASSTTTDPTSQLALSLRYGILSRVTGMVTASASIPKAALPYQGVDVVTIRKPRG